MIHTEIAHQFHAGKVGRAQGRSERQNGQHDCRDFIGIPPELLAATSLRLWNAEALPKLLSYFQSDIEHNSTSSRP